MVNTTRSTPGIDYKVRSQIITTEPLLDEMNFYHQQQGQVDQIEQSLTYILGRETNETPLLSMTLGGIGYGNRSVIEIAGDQYDYPVMIDTREGAMVSAYDDNLNGDRNNPDTKPGKNGTPVYLILSDNWIKRYYIIQSSYGTQLYVQEDPVQVGEGWRYKCRVSALSSNAYCSVEDLLPGVMWIELFTAVAESESRSTEGNMIMPGRFKNQISFMRGGMSWAGNASNKIMRFDMSVIGTNGEKKNTNLWLDYAMFEFEKRFAREMEHSLMYSKYNRRADGTVTLKDPLTDKPIPQGSGLLEQIPNKSTYARLTYESLTNKIGDALFNQGDSKGMTITLLTGTGGKREFDRAIREAGGTILQNFGAGGIGDKFVTGTGANLALGGFFDTMYHIDGYVIKVKYTPLFDRGQVAKVSLKHPETGLPSESYRMVFIDDNDIDGQPNIRFVCQKGRKTQHGLVKGLTGVPRSVEILTNVKSSEMNIATEQDKSTYTRLASGGIQIMRANRCFDLRCSIGK